MVEVLGGLAENESVITTGASALRDGDRISLPGDDAGGRRGGASARSGESRSGGRRALTAPAASRIDSGRSLHL
jgi:hypothetical protein